MRVLACGCTEQTDDERYVNVAIRVARKIFQQGEFIVDFCFNIMIIFHQNKSKDGIENMDFTVTIEKICKALEDDSKKIKDIINQQNHHVDFKDMVLNAFNPVLTFAPKDRYEDFTPLKNKSGVYVFQMDNDCPINANFDAVQGSKIRRGSKEILKKGEVLYIGKCEDLYQRMREHMDDNEKNKVGSLKLSTMPRENLFGNFTIYLFCLNETCQKHYDIIATKVERELRNSLLPRVGW